MLKELEKAIGYQFKDITLLQNALTHSSYANECWHDSLRSNERMEFLGDALLGLDVAKFLYASFPDRPEGELTRTRADMVCETTLAKVADGLELGKYLLLGHGEDQTGGRNRVSILADAVEALIAACYLDGGMEASKAFIDRFILTKVPEGEPRISDYKTALQELVQQKKGQKLTYLLVAESGPDHNKQFTVAVSLNGTEIGRGNGSSKKRAEQSAACAAMAKLRENIF